MASLTIENYVKAIFALSSQSPGRPATTGAIAEALRVSPGTVTCMLKTLDESRLATYTPYEGVVLTEAGRSLAVRVIRRHRLIELFLARTLDLSWDEVHDEAEHLEHAVSDLLIDRIDAYLGYPKTDPHGDPIPTADGEIAAIDGVRLADCAAGVECELVRVLDQDGAFLRFLSESGLGLDARFVVLQHQAEAGVLVVQAENRQPAPLSREAAGKLIVRAP